VYFCASYRITPRSQASLCPGYSAAPVPLASNVPYSNGVVVSPAAAVRDVKDSANMNVIQL
ncbi:hypothetical protein CEXT_330261, partial [Caerostris extrusa]